MIFKCIVSYDGYNYAGWQKQENALGIQSIIEEALTRILKEDITIVASGRTDARVHALGQVFHFETQRDIKPENLVRALNSILPPDIRVQKAMHEKEDFHARFSAKKKVYEYRCTYDTLNPFAYRNKAILYSKLDLKAMKKASEYLLGTHDFTSFSSSKIDPRKPRVKTIYKIDIEENENELAFRFLGNGFLRYQVRMMTGTLIEVGRHKIQPAEVKKILEAKDKEACRYNADPQGLYLCEVIY